MMEWIPLRLLHTTTRAPCGANKSFWNKLLDTLDEYFSSRAFGEQQEEESNSVGGDSLGGALAEYNMQVCKDLINA